MKTHIMAIATFFMVLIMSFGAVSAADSNVFNNVNMANSGNLNVNFVTADDNPMSIQGTMIFKGIQYDDYAAVKVKWTDSLPSAGYYFIKLSIDYVDKFGDIENTGAWLYVENGTSTKSEVISIDYMDLSKPANITIEAENISNSGLWEPIC